MTAGSDVVTILSNPLAGLTIIDREAVAVVETSSVTLAVKLNVPVVLDVPKITPDVSNTNPAGSDPAARDQE